MLTLHIKKAFLTLFKAVGKTILKIDLTVIPIVPLSEKEMGAFWITLKSLIYANPLAEKSASQQPAN